MKVQNALLYTVAVAPSLVLGDGYYSVPEWHPPSVGDVRGPCPMLNTLANHGYLPHSGKNININRTIDALGQALNIDAELATFLHNFAIEANPTPNATIFSLDNLSRHNVLEHDGSLSRADYYWTGDATSFNQTVFDETRSYWTTPIINIEQAAAARVGRLQTSQATNPDFSLSDLGSAFSIGESAAYLFVLGDKVSYTVERSIVEYLFENERLPTSLGWKRAADPISEDDLGEAMDRIVNATNTNTTTATTSRRGIHGRARLPQV
ncbi:hypothetical protein PFICI_14275 [Pestalotiopsis fici W106-1]|uniref:Heme haloperoxidase family profile domain-containing protein n=1 Tax=Pestalotiopsis fici (strain W106-1 / CGMCC3.15140) TaxID=1229662 RepID=W3WKZ0_PESFW|nr:uncharacterized protein PFICI_14275 [Pestalotiopsis fici W106-1]ETS74409.1 hypothetical protein PFICI_14275 [Pestalotiopsis fici W106-1]